MASFTGTDPNLLLNGPVVALTIAVTNAAAASLTANGHPVPTPITASAMIDTGASGSVLQTGLPAKLGLRPVGKRNINTPSSTDVPANEYAVRFLLPYGISLEATAVELPLQNQNIEALLGRDVLANGVLVYVGYTGTFTFSV